ncbi:shufflon system plasmid conjugative transfer pilus tip adhesin PilV [Escherichia coli]|nr:tail fiber protein [Escherichia coli]OZO67452.1 shufflon system plasmid conjugative transfer pilus tip adhesin PilV [Escherichia coli]OZO72336.1 shufflon system plasmid conjugative transfer pilus tip adhesin PilV [Escherichia coli]OZO77333.1 shufflon system plasmid conjugative transfer pilus tip adhesin PilV [Escherichia coli]OZP13575.1 shufflon system plasmid conjugative transfer pilus tip adhesin PilV [Escherichia coli]OZP21530.1 shufflon system plasmid conjugative transfer pilus tip adhe
MAMKMKIKKGFSLLELTLVLGVGTMVAFMKFQDMKNEQESILASAVGQQMKQIGEAVNGYINIRYDKLSTLSNAAGTGTDPGPRTCSGSVCEITYQTLINEGLLPSTYTGTNANKSSYKIILKRDGTSPNFVINGLITTSTAWIEGGKTRYDLLGNAMQTAGIDSGMTKTTSIASGHSGQWSETSANFNNITSAGQLAFRVGFNSALYSVYLRRDGTLPMTGDLNLDGHNINNVDALNATGNITTTGDLQARNIKATGKIDAGGNISAGNWVYAKNGYGNNIGLGGDAGGDDFEIKISGQKQIDVLSDDYTSIVFAVNGKIELRNPQSGAVGVNINYDGSINTIGTIKASGNIESSQNVKGATLESTGRATVGEFVQLNGQAEVGKECQSNGLQGRTVDGQILSCVNGVWNFSGEQPGTIKMWGTSNAPVGWLELNGQAFDKSKNPTLATLYPSGVVPDIRGQFVRAWDHGAGVDSESSRGILSTQGDAIRNLTGNIYGTAHFVSSGGNGVFLETRRVNWTDIPAAPEGKGSATFDTNFDASRQVPTAPENRPKNIALMYIIKKG